MISKVHGCIPNSGGHIIFRRLAEVTNTILLGINNPGNISAHPHPHHDGIQVATFSGIKKQIVKWQHLVKKLLQNLISRFQNFQRFIGSAQQKLLQLQNYDIQGTCSTWQKLQQLQNISMCLSNFWNFCILGSNQQNLLQLQNYDIHVLELYCNGPVKIAAISKFYIKI